MLGDIAGRLAFYAKAFYEANLTNAGPFFTEKDYPDLTGQKWLVTGATGGIGFDVAKILLGQGAELWLVGRSELKLQSTIKSLQQHFPSAKIHFAIIDYTDLRTVKPAIEKLHTETKVLNGIIHNAGVMLVPEGPVALYGFHQLGISVHPSMASILSLLETFPLPRAILCPKHWIIFWRYSGQRSIQIVQ